MPPELFLREDKVMGKKIGFAALKTVLGAVSLWNWGKVALLLMGCVALWTTEDLGVTERICVTGLFLYLLWTVILRALLPQQKVELDAGFVTVRTFYGREISFHLRDIGVFYYTARKLTLRGKDGELLCRLRRERWNMDPFLEDMVQYGTMNREGYVVSASAPRRIMAAIWLFLAVANGVLWGVLWFLSRSEPWETGALTVLCVLCAAPLIAAVVNVRRCFARKLLVQPDALRYIPAFGKGRDYRWEDIFWAAQPGGQVHLLEPRRQKKVAVLSGRDLHLYELFCDFYAHGLERVKISREGNL